MTDTDAESPSDENSEPERPRPRGRAESRVATDRDVTVEPGTWYWDRRAERPLYARRADDDSVEFVSVWLPEEAADALETGAVVQLDEMNFDRPEATFSLKDSYRTRLATGDDAGGA